MSNTALTPHMALKMEERQIIGRKRWGHMGANMSSSSATSLIKSAKRRHRFTSAPKSCEASAVNARPPSMALPSRAIQSMVAASEVMAAFPTPMPSRIFCVHNTPRRLEDRSCTTFQAWYRRYSGGRLAGKPAGKKVAYMSC